MPIIVCGAEGEWALYNNTLSTVGADDKRRGSVQLTAGETMFKAFSGGNDVWVHTRFAGSTIGNNSLGTLQNILQIRNSSNEIIAGIRCRNVANDGLFRVAFYSTNTNGGGRVDNSEIFVDNDFVFADYDIRLVRSTVTDPNDTMTVYFYRNAQLRLTVSNTDPTGWDAPAQILLSFASTDADYDDVFVQDVIVTNDVPTVGMELAVLVPSAVGNYSDFNNDYTNLDDVGYDASTVISTSTVDDRESWVFGTPAFDLGDKVIYGVVLDTIAQTDLATIIADFQPFLRISATDYPTANLGANNIAPDSFVSIYTINPATAAPWTETDLAGLEAGIRAV